MKNIIAFLFGWLIAAVILTPHAHASFTATPNLSGYARNAATGGYLRNTPGQVQYLLDAQLRYSGTGLVRVGGHTITIPAKIPLSAIAGNAAKAAMRATPWLLAGTLALDYLTDNGITWDETDGFTKADPSSGTYPGGVTWRQSTATPYTRYFSTGSVQSDCGSNTVGCSVEAAVNAALVSVGTPTPCSGGTCRTFPTVTSCTTTTTTRTCTASYVRTSDNAQLSTTVTVYATSNPAPAPQRIPVTHQDFDALPDPIPTIGPELASAPYMPNGAPVDNPQYTEGRYPLGDPYKAPDGTTRQDYAHVTNNNIDNSVTITTSTTTIADANGNPVTEPETETDTQPDECEKHPESVGCSSYGTPEPIQPLSTLTVPLNPDYSPVGGAGSCPAPITVKGITWSYQPICDFATAIRPLIIGFAWISFAFIVAGTVRT